MKNKNPQNTKTKINRPSGIHRGFETDNAGKVTIGSSERPVKNGNGRTLLITASLVLVALAAAFVSAMPGTGTVERAAVVPTPTPTRQLSKEYVYAGSRMLATEDTGVAPPGVPQIVNLDVRSQTQIDVYWNQSPASENVVSYNLRVNGSSVTTGITYSSWAVTGLTVNNTYSFEVQAVRASGAVSSWSAPVSATTFPNVSTPVLAAVQTHSSTQLDVYWSAPPPGETIASYNLRVNGTTVTTGITYLSWAVTGLTPGTTYSFEVQAVKSSGVTSVWSTPMNGTTAAAPNSTTIDAVVTVSSSQLNVFWAASSSPDVAGYNLRINGSTVITGITYTSYPATGLTANTAYSFDVQAVDSAGVKSAWSPAVSGTTSP